MNGMNGISNQWSSQLLEPSKMLNKHKFYRCKNFVNHELQDRQRSRQTKKLEVNKAI